MHAASSPEIVEASESNGSDGSTAPDGPTDGGASSKSPHDNDRAALQKKLAVEALRRGDFKALAQITSLMAQNGRPSPLPAARAPVPLAPVIPEGDRDTSDTLSGSEEAVAFRAASTEANARTDPVTLPVLLHSAPSEPPASSHDGHSAGKARTAQLADGERLFFDPKRLIPRGCEAVNVIQANSSAAVRGMKHAKASPGSGPSCQQM